MECALTVLFLNVFFGLVMPFTHIAGYVAAGIGLIAGMGKWKELRREPVFLAILAFIAYGTVRSAFSSYPSEGFPAMTGYLMQWMAPFVLGFSLRNTAQVKKSSEAYLLSFTVLVVFSVLAYFGLFYRQFSPKFMLVADGLLKGFHSHIALGALCLIVSFMSLGQALRRDLSTRARTAFGAGAAFFLIALLLTGSRGYYISAVVAYTLFGIFWVYRTGLWRAVAVSACAVLAVAAGLYMAVPNIQNRIHRTNPRDTNIIERFAMYRVALAEIKDRPVFGFGPGQAVLETKYYGILPPNLQDVQRQGHLHSQYLQLAADLGLTGLALFFVIVYFILRTCVRLSASADNFVRFLGIGFLFAAIGILTGECFDTLLRGPKVAMEFFWLAGMAAAALRCDRERTRP